MSFSRTVKLAAAIALTAAFAACAPTPEDIQKAGLKPVAEQTATRKITVYDDNDRIIFNGKMPASITSQLTYGGDSGGIYFTSPDDTITGSSLPGATQETVYFNEADPGNLKTIADLEKNAPYTVAIFGHKGQLLQKYRTSSISPAHLCTTGQLKAQNGTVVKEIVSCGLLTLTSKDAGDFPPGVLDNTAARNVPTIQPK